MNKRNHSGTVLISLLPEMLLIVAVLAGAIWGIRANWASFPDWAQTTLKVVGWVLGGLMVSVAGWTAWRDRGEHPGF